MRPLVVRDPRVRCGRRRSLVRPNATPCGTARRSGAIVALLGALLGMPLRAQTLPAASAAVEPGTAAMPPLQGARAEAPLERIVSLELRDVPLRQALDAIDQQAHLGLTYSTRVVPLERPVTITSRNVTAGEALSIVLAGTGVRAVPTAGGTVMLVASESAASDTTLEGIVWGQVVDSTSHSPLSGAVVGIKGTAISTVSNARGFFFLPHVTAGVQAITVRQIGYVPLERDVAVEGGRRVRLLIELHMTMTRLQQVVTTATGRSRILELGNDITVINADSIVKTQPISSVTDLLENRVPGLTVQRESGVPGAPARLRLRGVGSIALSNDPIIIVDGIRVYSSESAARDGNLAAGGYSAPSVLDQIDVNSIERIEVFKGPSAASMYGPDAANGVIVITTKHGQSGPPRWTASLQHGVQYIPGAYPLNYLRWGHSATDNAPELCPLVSVTCAADSLVTFQLLNDRATSPLTQGQNSQMTLAVSGNRGGIGYSIGGNYRDVTGTTQMPSFETGRYVSLQGTAAPGWMQHPDELTQWGGTLTLRSQLGTRSDVSITSMLEHTRQQRSNLDSQIGTLMSSYLDRGTGQYYNDFGSPESQSYFTAYGTRVTDESTHLTTGVDLDWNPTRWLTGTVQAGLDVTDRRDGQFTPPGIVMTSSGDSVGTIGAGSGASVVKTVNLQLRSAGRRLPFGVQADVAVGANYMSTVTADNAVVGRGLPNGATSVDQAAVVTGSQSSGSVGTFGVYVQPTLHRGGLWLESGLRLDGGSSYGSAVAYTPFPKVSLSYLVSNERWFPRLLRSVFQDLRLRSAYGQAGRVPTPEQRLRLYQLGSAVLDGQTGDAATLNSLGNDRLQPERTGELEGGFDADVIGGRVSISFTGYRKITRNALLDIPVAPSVYGGTDVLRNIGTVSDIGFEAEIGVDVLRSAAFTWREQATVSHNANTLVTLDQGVAPQQSSGLILRPGYPVTGVWSYPLLGYSDRNGDGIIEPNEVLLGDTLVYMGAAMPPYQGSLNTTLGFLHNTLSLDAGLSYESGFVQQTKLGNYYRLTRGANDPSAPLAMQAAAAYFLAVQHLPGGPYGGEVVDYPGSHRVSEMRLNDLAITWRVPEAVCRWFGTQALSVALQGTNLWLHTNYPGKDPNVNSGHIGGFELYDYGVVPQPRTWQLHINASY